MRPNAVNVLCERVGYRALRSFGAGVSAEDRVIQGAVNAAHEAVVPISLRGPGGRSQDIEAVVDTGYNGFLTLPGALVTELELPFAHVGRALLANDDEVSFDVHHVTVALGRSAEAYQGRRDRQHAPGGYAVAGQPQPEHRSRERRPRPHTGQALAGPTTPSIHPPPPQRTAPTVVPSVARNLRTSHRDRS